MQKKIKNFLWGALIPCLSLAFDVLAGAKTLPLLCFPSSLIVFVLYGALAPAIDGTTIPDLSFPNEPYYTMGFFLAGMVQWLLIFAIIRKLRSRD